MAAGDSGVSRDTQLATWVELSHLRAIEVLPESFEGARIGSDVATPVYDVNGEMLFLRTPLQKGRTLRGYADIAVNPVFGEPLLAVSTGVPWDERGLVNSGGRVAQELGIDATDVRFVAYSFPKIALQFLRNDDEIAMLELYTWIPVPRSERGRQYEPPSNFERWSFVDEMPDDVRLERIELFRRRMETWQGAFGGDQIDYTVVNSKVLIDLAKIERFVLWRSRELHYSTRNTDHFTCYELRGQETNVWCVAASVQMLLDFYRYEYSQVRLAQELGLGTLANPTGLPYSQDQLVVTVLEKMTCQSLDAAMNPSPYFSEFESEIDANRPLISFIPSHSRTVAGYTHSFLALLGQAPFRGLLVYDPWPPNAGVITRWENFNTSSYRRTFTARVCRV